MSCGGSTHDNANAAAISGNVKDVNELIVAHADITQAGLVNTGPTATRTLAEVTEAGNKASRIFHENAGNLDALTPEETHDLIQFASTMIADGMLAGVATYVKARNEPGADDYINNIKRLRELGNMYRDANPDATRKLDMQWIREQQAEAAQAEQEQKQKEAAAKAARAAAPQPNPLNKTYDLDALAALTVGEANQLLNDKDSEVGRQLRRFVPTRGKIVRLTRKSLNGLDAMNIVYESEYSGRESEYFTEDGFEVTRLRGQFSDGYSWAVSGGNMKQEWNRFSPGVSGLSGSTDSAGAANLDVAAEIIRTFRRLGANPG